MPLPIDLSLPALLSKARLAFISNEAETSEKPEFAELKTRRYPLPAKEVYDLATQLVNRWFGWRIVGRGKNLGGMAHLKCEMISILLGGNKLEISILFSEETDSFGLLSTVVNIKSLSQAPTKGDLGENRRWIAFLLFNLDSAVSEAVASQHATVPSPAIAVEPTRPSSTEEPVTPNVQEAPARKRLTIKQL